MLLGTEKFKFADMNHLVNFKAGIMEEFEKDEIMREVKFEDLKYVIKYGVDEKATSKDLKPGQILHTISTDDIDRDYEVIRPKGGDFKWFKKNPVVIWGHNYFDNKNVIGGNVKLMREEHAIRAITQFDLEMAKAEEIYGQYQRRFLRAWSIGFIETRGRRVPVDEGGAENWPPKAGQIWWVIEKWSMFEYSAVPVPSNPAALTDATAKNFTVDGSVLKDIENYVLKIKEDENENDRVIIDLGQLDSGKSKKEGEKTEEEKEDAKIKSDELQKCLDQMNEKSPLGWPEYKAEEVLAQRPKGGEYSIGIIREDESFVFAFDSSGKLLDPILPVWPWGDSKSEDEEMKTLKAALKRAEKLKEQNDTLLETVEAYGLTGKTLDAKVDELTLANAELKGRVEALKEIILVGRILEKDPKIVDPKEIIEEAIVKELNEGDPKEPIVLTLTADGKMESKAKPKEIKAGDTFVVKIESTEKMAENISKGLDMSQMVQVLIDKKRGIVT